MVMVTGCVQVKDDEARSFDQRLRQVPGVVAAASTAYGTWRSDPKVVTKITVDDQVTAKQLAHLVVTIPELESAAGLGGIEMSRTITFATGGPVVDLMFGDGLDRGTLEVGAEDLLKVRASLPAVSMVQMDGAAVNSYSVSVAHDVPGLLALARRAASLKLRAPGTWWHFSTARRGTEIEFDPRRQPTLKLVEQWRSSVAALALLPDGFKAGYLSFDGAQDSASLQLNLRHPGGVPVRTITPARYGAGLVPVLHRLEALVGDGGTYEVVVDTLSMISLGNLPPSYDKMPAWTAAWSADWEKALIPAAVLSPSRSSRS
jgi:hypothetical protein